MRSDWSPGELVESWTLLGDDWKRVANKSGATRLGFAVLLKFFELEARFPRTAVDVPSAAVAYVAEQVSIPAARFADYWEAAPAIKRHRVEIRGVYGFRETTRADEEMLTAWLAEEVCPVALAPDELVDAVLARCRASRIEPPGRIERIVGSARARFEQQFCEQTVERLGPECAGRLEGLVDEASTALPELRRVRRARRASPTRFCRERRVGDPSDRAFVGVEPDDRSSRRAPPQRSRR